MSPQSQSHHQSHPQSHPVVSSQEAANSQNEPFPVNFFTELGRGPMVMMAKGISAMCQGNEALRGIQQNAAHEASAHHADIVQKLFEPCAPGDLMAMQTELLRHNVQSASKYWQQLAAQMVQTQVAMVRSVGEVFNSEKGMPVQLPQAGSFFNFDPLAWTGSPSSQSSLSSQKSARSESGKNATQH